MAWAAVIKYKTRLGARLSDTHITSLKPFDNDMPSSPAPFITPFSLVTIQHDLKTRINSSSLVKVPLTMRPLIKKRPSIPFSLTFKRHSLTIFSRPPSTTSDASTLSDCTPSLEKVDPMSVMDVAIDSPPETPLHSTPSIGTKIVDRFWPEDEAPYSEENCLPVLSCYPTALAPPPYHHRAPRSLGSIRDVPIGDPFSSRTTNERNTGPLRFPF